MALTGMRRPSGLSQTSFPRSARLTLPHQFAANLRVRAPIKTARFALHVNQNADVGAWRLGLVVPKRFEASSVRRNAIRRAFREAFRLHRAALEKATASHDLVVRLHAKGERLGLAAFKQACADDAGTLFALLLARLNFPVSESLPCVPS